MKRHLWDVSRTVLPHRHVFDFNQALMDFGATLCTARKPKCLICPMQAGCRAYPVQSRATSAPRRARRRVTHRRHRRRHRARRRAISSRAGRAASHLEGHVGVSRRQVRGRRDARGRACGGSCARSSAADVDVGDEICSPSRTHYPERSVELHFFACDADRRRRGRCSARRCAGCRATSCGSLQFPPADDELIARATERRTNGRRRRRTALAGPSIGDRGARLDEVAVRRSRARSDAPAPATHAALVTRPIVLPPDAIARAARRDGRRGRRASGRPAAARRGRGRGRMDADDDFLSDVAALRPRDGAILEPGLERNRVARPCRRRTADARLRCGRPPPSSAVDVDRARRR